MLPLLTIPIVIIAGYLISKKFQTQAVLLISGIVLILLSMINGQTSFLPAKVSSTGSSILDIFQLISGVFSMRVGEIGMIIMSAGGFAKYMEHIGAADAMVNVSIRPLNTLKSPYLVLALCYTLGQILHIFIPSAAGLAMLLLVSMFPVLIGLGVSPAAAAAVIATTSCMDLGPASGSTNFAARTAGMDTASYFVDYQLKTAILTIIVVTTLHFIVQRYFDKKLLSAPAEKSIDNTKLKVDIEQKKPPKLYAILPLLPLILLLVFSEIGIKGLRIDVVTAMFISLFVSMTFELIRLRNLRSVLAAMSVFFGGMGNIFAKVVTLIVAAEVFTTGLKAIGFIDLMLGSASDMGFGPVAMTVTLVVLIAFTAFITGSGNAAFFSFAGLAPNIASSVNHPVVVMLLPMQFASSIFRSMSPVSGVVIAVSGAAGVSPLEVVKRTTIPMIGGMISVLIANVIFY